MRIFNPDGTEAEMCGNGARCIALYMGRVESKIETKAGIISSKVNGERERIKLTDPKNLSLDTPLKINNRVLHVNFIDTGVPHVGVFVQGLEAIEVVSLGRKLRYHQRFAPKGTNANFIEVLDNHSIKIRTYERGVEDETLACGTGTVASALLFALKNNARDKINVYTRSKEVLRVYFKKQGSKFSDVWLEGKARLVFKGEAKL
jgi:diaminopimelate epimerase